MKRKDLRAGNGILSERLSKRHWPNSPTANPLVEVNKSQTLKREAFELVMLRLFSSYRPIVKKKDVHIGNEIKKTPSRTQVSLVCRRLWCCANVRQEALGFRP